MTAEWVLGSPSMFRGGCGGSTPSSFPVVRLFLSDSTFAPSPVHQFSTSVCASTVRDVTFCLCASRVTPFTSPSPRMMAHLGCWRRTWGSFGARHIGQAEAGTFGGRRISVTGPSKAPTVSSRVVCSDLQGTFDCVCCVCLLFVNSLQL